MKSSSLRSFLPHLETTVALAPFDDSIRSVDSQSSTIPVHSDDGSSKKQQHHTRHVSFDLIRVDIIRPLTCKRVRFADETKKIPKSEYPYEAHRMWYTQADYRAFQRATRELCDHFGDRPWFQMLYDKFRSSHDQNELLQEHSQQQRQAPATTLHVEALYLGLEHWTVPTGRRVRRYDLLEAMECIQQQQKLHQQRQRQEHLNKDARQRQQRLLQEASQDSSCAVSEWAAYIGEHVAQSVNDQPEEVGNTVNGSTNHSFR